MKLGLVQIILFLVLLGAGHLAEAQTQANSLAVLMPVIETEFLIAKETLNKNTISHPTDIETLISKLDDIMYDINTYGLAERKGVDSEWRGAFIIIQAVIEKSLAQAITEKKLTSCQSYIVTPRMPSPFMLTATKTLDRINITNPIAFAELRRGVLEEYLQSGCKLHAVYSQDAYKLLANDPGIKIYKTFLDKYKDQIIDKPVLTVGMKHFPSEKSGALYYLNNDRSQVIALSSTQLSQLNEYAEILWSIRFGANATEHVKKIDDFLKENGAADLVK